MPVRLPQLPVTRPVAIALFGGAVVVGFTVGAAAGTVNGGGEGRNRQPATAGASAAPVTPVGASATCQQQDGRDATGATVSYAPMLAIDADVSTAWRCPGDGVGQVLTIDLGGATQISELGIVPGYAKTDPADGTDRYAENRRLTKVRWTFDGGVSLEQELDPAPDNRGVQRIKTPGPLSSAQVTMEVLSSADAPRNTMAVGTVEILGAAQ